MDRNAAFIAFYESHHMADGRGFPASVRADKPEYAALFYTKRKIKNAPSMPVIFGEILHFNDVFHVQSLQTSCHSYRSS